MLLCNKFLLLYYTLCPVVAMHRFAVSPVLNAIYFDEDWVENNDLIPIVYL